jgi:hypothetical protein
MLCSTAVSQEFTTTGLTTRNKFIGFLVLLIKSTTPIKMELLPSSQEPTPLAHDDDFCLQNPTAAPPSFSFKTIVIVVLLIFVCLLWKKL